MVLSDSALERKENERRKREVVADATSGLYIFVCVYVWYRFGCLSSINRFYTIHSRNSSVFNATDLYEGTCVMHNGENIYISFLSFPSRALMAHTRHDT